MRWVIVGAGSGGCVAARRLHDAGHEVVLVETGPPLEQGRVPASIDGPDALATLGEPGRIHSGLLAERVAGGGPRPYLRGRGVGGSSAVNAMVALDADPALYRSWGWDDADLMRERILVPTAPAAQHELGRTDRLLLAADERARAVSLTRSGGRRITAAEAYLWPIADSERLTVLHGTVVERVVVDDVGAATGALLADGEQVDADCVVVAAGAIHTPAVLLRSGIGNETVGYGLQDHPAAVITIAFNSAATARSATKPSLATASCLECDPIQLLPLNHLGPGVSREFGALMVALMRPESRSGRVSLVSDDPHEHPRVNFRLLDGKADVARLRDGVRLALETLATEVFASVVRETYIDDVGTPTSHLATDTAIEDWLCTVGADYVHATSSCADAIDPDGRLVGHEGVYVCDAAAFPSIPNVNTHIPTMLLAERFVARWTHRE